MAKKKDEEKSKDTTKIEEKNSKKANSEKEVTPKGKVKKVGKSSNETAKKQLGENSKTAKKEKEITSKKEKPIEKTVKVEKKTVKKETEENEEADKKEEEKNSKEIVKIEDIKKTIKAKKTVPKTEIDKINKILFTNIIIAICIITYFIFLNLGQMNIKHDVYTTDLKVFSMCILVVAICLIEVAYKRDSGEIALYGVEMIVLSITTVALIYVDLMFSMRYIYIVPAISFVFAVYYLIKSIIIYSKRKKMYFVNNMKEIMNKDDEV